MTEPDALQRLRDAVRGPGEVMGYHQGGWPLTGATVRYRSTDWLVLVRRGGSDMLLMDGKHRLALAGYRDIKRASAPRQSLRQVVTHWVAMAKESPRFLPALALAGLFRGTSGTRYSNRDAELWMLYASIRLLIAEPRSPTEHWLDRLLAPWKELAGPGLPPPFSLHERDVLLRRSPPDDAFTDATTAAIARALEVGAEQLAMADLAPDEDGGDADVPHADDVAGRIAIDREHGITVMVLGASRISLAAGYVDVVDLDTLRSFVRHLSALDLQATAADPAWQWDVVARSARRHDEGPSPLWFGSSLRGPDGAESAHPARRRLAVISALMALRMTGAGHACGRLGHKTARAWLRDLPMEERRDLLGRAPELMVAKATDTRVTAATPSLYPALLAELDAFEATLPPPTPSAPQPAPAAEPLLPVAAAEPPPPVPLPDPVPHQGRSKVVFPTTTRALRFQIVEHPAFAAEWELENRPDAHEAAVATALAWLGDRLGMPLPGTWNAGSHEIERAGVTLNIESEARLFATRLEHPDTEHPTRWWRVEATVLRGRADAGGMVGLRIQVRDLVEGLPPPARTLPGLVRLWATSPGLRVSGAGARSTLALSEPRELERLEKIIRRRDRAACVAVVQAGGVRLNGNGPLLGLARVVTVSPALPAYQARFGVLPRDAVHLFPPGQSRPETLAGTGEGWVEALRLRAMDARNNPHTPSFRDVRQAISEYRTTRAPTVVAVPAPEATAPDEAAVPAVPAIAPAEVEVPQAAPVPDGPSLEDIQRRARSEIREYEELLEAAEQERDAVEAARVAALAERDAARVEAHQLRMRLDALRASRGASAAAQAWVPDTLAELEAWAQQLAPRLVIADKALRHAAKIDHREVGKIYGALRALSEHYWQMKFGQTDDERQQGRAQWFAYLPTQRLTCSPVGRAIETARYAAEYRATIEGTTYTASQHVAGNDAHDPARCLRIYFEPDEANHRVIVVHLPTHLTNFLT